MPAQRDRPISLIITCEHGGNQVPATHRSLFCDRCDVLKTHRGYDPGALELARRFARHFRAPLLFSTTTRLLVDLNRSIGHPKLFSEFSRVLDREERQRVLERHYRPHRQRVEAAVREVIDHGGVALHLAVHSFTPVLDGEIRRADIGLLYDPSRPLERDLCRRWQQAIHQANADLRVRRNYPYFGTADGLTTSLRTRFGANRYAGIELEVNQRWPEGDRRTWQDVQRLLVESLTQLSQQRLPAGLDKR